MPFFKINKSPQKYLHRCYYKELANFISFCFHINMQNNISNISFKSNIRFIPYKTLDKMLNNSHVKYSGAMFDLCQINKVEQSSATKGIIYCVSGVLKNMSENIDYLYHWCPDYLFKKPSGKKDNSLLAIGKKLQETKTSNEVKGFIIGGLSKSCDTEKSELSLKLINYFKKMFNAKERSNFTVFFSQKTSDKKGFSPRSAFIYSKKEDTYYVNCQKFDIFKDEDVDILDKNQLKNNFDFINISDEDKVFIGIDSNEDIPKSFWQKNNFKKAKTDLI